MGWPRLAGIRGADGTAVPGFVAPQDGGDEGGGEPAETSLALPHAEAVNFAGKEVEVVCQATSDAKLPPGLMICYRFRIACCAADAQPIFVFVKSDEGALPAHDAWVRARGRLSLYEHRRYTVPLITAETMAAEKEPAIPFLF